MESRGYVPEDWTKWELRGTNGRESQEAEQAVSLPFQDFGLRLLGKPGSSSRDFTMLVDNILECKNNVRLAGRAEGEQIGIGKGEFAVSLRQLTSKLGRLPEEVVDRLEPADVPRHETPLRSQRGSTADHLKLI